jgi:DNA-binding NarL/FixJ family response regulator
MELHEVATLIARGLTNSQIAERLVISPHTVERHVENILDRLRLSSRDGPKGNTNNCAAIPHGQKDGW